MSRTAIIVGPQDHGRRMSLAVLNATQSIKTRLLPGFELNISAVFAAAAGVS
jgi:hypothetical protein